MTIQSVTITDRIDWLKWRKRFMTASDVGAIFGLDPYKSPLMVWADKTQDITQSETPAMRRGRWLEGAVAAAYKDSQSEFVMVNKCQLFYFDEDWRLAATPDYYSTKIDGSYTSVQCKTVAKSTFEKSWSDGPPTHYYLQALTEAMLVDADRAILAVLIIDPYGADYREYEVPRHAEAEQRIREGALKFWHDIEAGIQPKPDYQLDGELLKTLRGIRPEPEPAIDLGTDNRLADILAQRQTLTARRKEIEAELSAADAEIVDKLNGASLAYCGEWQITRKMQKRSGYSVEATEFPVMKIIPRKDTD
jgi:putative phage-type endonuclease